MANPRVAANGDEYCHRCLSKYDAASPLQDLK